jgi:hypothetical protein
MASRQINGLPEAARSHRSGTLSRSIAVGNGPSIQYSATSSLDAVFFQDRSSLVAKGRVITGKWRRVRMGTNRSPLRREDLSRHMSATRDTAK